MSILDEDDVKSVEIRDIPIEIQEPEPCVKRIHYEEQAVIESSIHVNSDLSSSVSISSEEPLTQDALSNMDEDGEGGEIQAYIERVNKT